MTTGIAIGRSRVHGDDVRSRCARRVIDGRIKPLQAVIGERCRRIIVVDRADQRIRGRLTDAQSARGKGRQWCRRIDVSGENLVFACNGSTGSCSDDSQVGSSLGTGNGRNRQVSRS